MLLLLLLDFTGVVETVVELSSLCSIIVLHPPAVDGGVKHVVVVATPLLNSMCCNCCCDLPLTCLDVNRIIEAMVGSKK